MELADDRLPDETTILRFRHLLERHELTAALFEAIREVLEAKRLLLKGGTIVDATILAAPSSTKNAPGTRDPEMRQTKKGNQWYFGMKVHIGTDTRGIVHSLRATDAAVADRSQLPALLHGKERVLYGDRAYWNEADRQAWTAAGGEYKVNQRGSAARPLTPVQRERHRQRSRTRARGEHPFLVVKRLWDLSKVRCRGLRKNLARAYTMFGLANLYLLRRRLLPRGWEPRLA